MLRNIGRESRHIRWDRVEAPARAYIQWMKASQQNDMLVAQGHRFHTDRVGWWDVKAHHQNDPNRQRACRNLPTGGQNSGAGVMNGPRAWLIMLRLGSPKTTKSATRSGGALHSINSGSVLLSQGISPQVPSALRGLTSVFGMGTGVTLSLWPPETCCQFGCTPKTPEQARAD